MGEEDSGRIAFGGGGRVGGERSVSSFVSSEMESETWKEK
jgi:hypothetical protein